MTASTRIARAHITLAAVYLVVALLSLVDFILAQFGLAPSLGNLYWFRLHMITIGVLAQAVMGVLPLLLARQLRTAPPNPAAQWAVLALLNLGLLLLSFGQVLWCQPLRSSGGWVLLVTLTAWLALLVQMWRRAPRPRPLEAAFFLAGPSYLLLGVLMALSMLESWPSPAGYQAVKESHVHNNIFGFTGIVLAGVALNVLPGLFGRSLAEGSRWSLLLLNLSVAAVWLASIVLPWSEARAIVAAAYGLLLVATLPYVWRLFRMLRCARTQPALATLQA